MNFIYTGERHEELTSDRYAPCHVSRTHSEKYPDSISSNRGFYIQQFTVDESLVVRDRTRQVVEAPKLRGRKRNFDGPVVAGRIFYRHGQDGSSPLSSFRQLQINGGLQALTALVFRSLYRPDDLPTSRWGHIGTDGRTLQEHSYTVVEVKILHSSRLSCLEIGEHPRERLEDRRIGYSLPSRSSSSTGISATVSLESASHWIPAGLS